MRLHYLHEQLLITLHTASHNELNISDGALTGKKKMWQETFIGIVKFVDK
jgi:hypothetical protein